MKKGLLYAILASVLWAIVNPFIKQGLSYDFTPMNFAGLRFTSVGAARFFAGKYIFTFMLESRCILFRNFQLPAQLEFMYNHCQSNCKR